MASSVATSRTPPPKPSTDTACFHCGEPIPPGIDLHVSSDGDSLPVCCRGCQAVADLILRGGLGRYYRFRESLADRAGGLAGDQAGAVLSAWRSVDERPELWGRDAGDGTRELLLQIEGVHCAACGWLIRSHLERNAGISAVGVDTGTGFARIRWRPDTIRLSDIAAALLDIGYRPHLPVHGAEEEGRQAERRQSLKRLGVAGLGMMQVMMYAVGLYTGESGGMTQAQRGFLEWVSLLVTLPVLLYSGRVFFDGAWRSLRARRPGMDVPVALAISLAFGASCINFLSGAGEVWFDSVVMFIFFLSLGRHFELILRHRNLQSGAALARLLPEWAERRRDDVWETVPAMDLEENDRYRTPPGKAFAADGTLLGAEAMVDESLLTGESDPVKKTRGEAVLAGTVNLGGPVDVKVTAASPDSMVSSLGRQLLSAQAGAQATDTSTGQLGRHAMPPWLVPVFIVAVLTIAAATWMGWQWFDPDRAFAAMLAVLVASCPCALSLALPATRAAACSFLLTRHVLVADTEALLRSTEVDSVVFDKTGTLTQGRLSLESMVINPQRTEWSREELLALAGALETASLHPIGAALRAASAGLPGLTDSAELPGIAEVTDLDAEPGLGVSGRWRGRRWRLGAPQFAASVDADDHRVWLADETSWVARFEFADRLKTDAGEVLDRLRRRGLELKVLSGDSPRRVDEVAGKLGITDWRARLSAGDKVEYLEAMRRQGSVVLAVGDGVNDAPLLAAADLSIAVHGGADLANRVSDFVLLGDALESVDLVLETGHRTRQLMRQNMIWALVYNASVMPLAVAGILQPWMAAVGMSLSSLLVVLNAARVSRGIGPVKVVPVDRGTGERT